MAVALITGGLRGIGRAITTEFLTNGWSVYTFGRVDRPEIRAALDQQSQPGSWLRHVAVDLSDMTALQVALGTMLEDPAVTAAGGLGVAINNAATQGPIGTLGEVALDDWIACQIVNLHAPVAICKRVLPHMKARGGAILNFTGGGGAKAQNFFSAYSTSKAAIVRYTECLARELREEAPNVACFAITPGFVTTDIHQATLDAGPGRAREFHQFVQTNLAKGGQDPMKIARFCLKLTNPEYAKFSGRFLSAAFDDIDDPAFAAELENDPDLFTLRRIDNFAFKRT